MQYLVQNVKKNKLANAFYFIFFIYPYIFLINNFFPSFFLEKNFYLIFLTLTIAALFLLSFFSMKAICKPKYLISSAIAVPLILLYLRIILYNENVSSTLINFRMLSTIIMYWSLAYVFVTQSEESKKIVTKIIMFNCVIQASIGILHHYVFPTLLLNPNLDNQLGGVIHQTEFALSRETGLLFNASVYGYFILLGIFIFYYKSVRARCIKLWDFFLAMMMLWGIILSESRFPVSMGFILIFMTFVNRKSTYSLMIWLAIGIIALFTFSSVIDHNLFSRFKNDHLFKKRDIENDTAIKLITENATNFTIGVPYKILSDPSFETGDNSYYAMLLSYGIFGFSLWIAMAFYFLKRTVIFRRNKIVLVFLIGSLAIVSSIYWDVWILYFFSTLYCIQLNNAHMSSYT